MFYLVFFCMICHNMMQDCEVMVLNFDSAYVDGPERSIDTICSISWRQCGGDTDESEFGGFCGS